jgi:hypothetical protein
LVLSDRLWLRTLKHKGHGKRFLAARARTREARTNIVGTANERVSEAILCVCEN